MKLRTCNIQASIIIALIAVAGGIAAYFIAAHPYRYPPFEQVKAAGLTSMTEFEFRQLPPDVQGAYVRAALAASAPPPTTPTEETK